MISLRLQRIPWMIVGVIAAIGLATGLFFAVRFASAAVSGSPCAGNVCTGTMVVGGQAVQYAYTQHIAEGSGELKIRLNGGLYDTSQLVSYIVYDAPAFSSWGKYANPTNGAVLLSQEDVNPGRTAYELRDTSLPSSSIVDLVMTLSYPSLSPGAYTFSFTVVQNGDTGGKNGLTFYVDAAAPPNDDESFAWAGVVLDMDYPCADGVDNDLNYYGDCADAACIGEYGDAADLHVCEQPENTCNDAFDNDADGLIDCLDPDCDGKVGHISNGALCQFGNEYGLSSCTDNFDNDGDGREDCYDNLFVPPGSTSTTCWKQSLSGCPAVESCGTGIDDDIDKSYDDAWDAQALTGVNCQDYDCAGDPACPAKENQTAVGDDADAQCFDGLDNDLDHQIDCADPDCLGIFNPANPTQICFDKEFDLGQSYQYCGNVFGGVPFDDDGDGPANCDDSDCKRQFGNCGPCPSREDITFDACADNKDNDSDIDKDCADVDCLSDVEGPYPRLGRFDKLTLGDDAYCATAESGGALCGDGFDNDKDGTVDCADTGCAGVTLSDTDGSWSCQPSGETSCNDGRDNDGDGAIDCLDDGCYGSGSCASALQTAVCRIVPQYSSATAFTANDPTVTVDVAITDHVSTSNEIHLVGSGTYESVTVILGDNGDPTAYYPYASLGNCSLSGTNATQFLVTAIDQHFVQIFNISQPVNGFDLTLSCLTPSTPASAVSYPISLSALKTPGSVPEYGDLSFSTTLFEATAPVVLYVVPEGEVGGTVRVPYGDSLRFRVVANDPGVAPNATGICGCDLDIAGTPFASSDGNCLIEYEEGTSDPYTPLLDSSPALSAQAEDGAYNFSAVVNPSIAIDVVPSVDEDLNIFPSKPFFRDEDRHIVLDASFLSSLSVADLFDPPTPLTSSCRVHLYRFNGTDYIDSGSGTPLFTFVGTPSGNSLTCHFDDDLPASPFSGSWNDGEYFLTIKAQDGSGDVIESRKAAIYVCNTVPAAGAGTETVCAKADFDHDGASEGLYTTLYSTAPKACDNCVGLPNATQQDENANGVGDACEPNNPDYGRCEVDTELVCVCDSDAATCADESLRCPQTTDPVGEQQCLIDWGLCTFEGQVCFEDEDCPGGPGVCGGDSITACYDDADCATADVDGPCLNADKCENLLFPWLQTVQGDVFSSKKVIGEDYPPEGQFNATYCITAKDTIVNFSSELCTANTDSASQYERPTADISYASVLGRIDVPGLLDGKYGDVVALASDASNVTFPLDRKVYVIEGQDLTIGSLMSIASGTGSDPALDPWGSGTIVVNGGDLIIDKNITYDGVPIDRLWKVPSIAWIVLDDGSGTKGNIYIDKAVTEISGAFYAEGADGVHTVKTADIEGKEQLVIRGLMIARKFHFSRSFKSFTEGSERFIYDGHAVVNPPPGLEDISRALPVFRDAAY